MAIVFLHTSERTLAPRPALVLAPVFRDHLLSVLRFGPAAGGEALLRPLLQEEGRRVPPEPWFERSGGVRIRP